VDGVDVSVGDNVWVGESVEVTVEAIGVDVSIVEVAAVGAEGSDNSIGAQETNIHVKQIPIQNRLCIAYDSLSI
jgi:hypothetical protein